MPNEPEWLPRQVVIDTNLDAVAETGEQHALIFPDRLDGALARPQNRFLYEEVEDIVDLYTSLLFAIANAHAFEQGNKRTALTSANMFLAANGFELHYPDRIALAEYIKAVIEGWLSEDDFVEIIHEYVLPSED